MAEELNRDAKDVLRVASKIQDLFESVRDRLPEGTHFALAIEVPPPPGGYEGRVLVASTDRERMALRLGEWITSDVDPLGVKKNRG